MREINIQMTVNSSVVERTRELTSRFAQAMCELDITEIASFLHDEYQYHKKSKRDFLIWLQEKFTENFDRGIYYMPVKMKYCLNCKPGNPTLIFNQGFFPTEVDGRKEQKGFMLDFVDCKIAGITICYKWCDEQQLQSLCALN